MSDFFNTINIKNNELENSIKTAKSQEEIIYIFFTLCPNKSFTPFEILRSVNLGDNVPITSVRRAISNLESKNLLVKTGEQRVEEYGKVNECWKLRVKNYD